MKKPPEITEEKKNRLENFLKRERIFPYRGELHISGSPEGKIGNVKAITNY